MYTDGEHEWFMNSKSELSSKCSWALGPYWTDEYALAGACERLVNGVIVSLGAKSWTKKKGECQRE